MIAPALLLCSVASLWPGIIPVPAAVEEDASRTIRYCRVFVPENRMKDWP
jgi:hypothetical protein